ncbi:M14 family metallopeptidase [Moheibacter lacus]|uniref:M14 family metallopeptidase n=1 Tax=Moheibacter lacus TaxID=2745851 RepID=A0A838ZTZ4_9FLAO|nr:M14 family metallopeptidase [Moheibacter lacus]MBA5630475.1 M14 family metallopeptidase [Moheibacter lacus]
MKKIIWGIVFLTFQLQYAQNIKIPFELTDGNKTSTYFEVIDFWKNLDENSTKIKMMEKGITDSGFPLHLVLIDNSGEFDIKKAHQKGKTILLINNGIHPGEPDGIDASMLLGRDITVGKYKLPDNVILAIIPVYNIGGTLKRSEFYRVDQNGPDEVGSRGNAQNLDLNRDYIKCDSKNARSFTQIFHELDPDIFVDNHVSNGADYQHVMTLLTTQHSKLGGEMGKYINQIFEPALYKSMQKKGYDLIPYVNVWGKTPDDGWNEYVDSPRYSSGFGTLWSTFCFVPETHMLKPYKQRVDATYELMVSFIEFTSANSQEIKSLRNQTIAKEISQKEFPIAWKHNPEKFQNYLFKGFEAGYKKSEVSGLERLYYDRNKPYEKQIPIYNHFDAELVVEKPKAYIIPQGWWKVIELLKLNQIEMRQLEKDTEIEVEVYKIENYESSPLAYESHHINSKVEISKTIQKKKFRKGDWYIPMNQKANRFLMETLEPQAMDSYFAWNFFDGILQQKEGFSPYVFEDLAADYLKENPELRNKLEAKKKSDPEFAKNAYAQLVFVYENSPWMEPGFMQYPVFRVL